MRTSVLVAILVAASMGASGAYAATVTNKDKVTHKVTLTEGSKVMHIAFKANQTRKDICKKAACELTLGKSSVKLAKNSGMVSIKDGKLMMAK